MSERRGPGGGRGASSASPGDGAAAPARRGSGNAASHRVSCAPCLAHIRRDDAPGYDELINYTRARDKDQVQCVMCGRRPGAFVVIPRQNKDVCRECDRVIWYQKASDVYFKWCKGCKRFLNLVRFGDKTEAAKCEKCRQRGRQSYLLKKTKANGQTAAKDAEHGLATPGGAAAGSKAGALSARGAKGSSSRKSLPLREAPLAEVRLLSRRRPRSASEGNWFEASQGGRPVLVRLSGDASPPPSGRRRGPAAGKIVRGVLVSQSVGSRRVRTLSQSFGSPLEAFSSSFGQRRASLPAGGAEGLLGGRARDERKRKRAFSCSSIEEESAASPSTRRPRTSSVTELAIVAERMLQEEAERDLLAETSEAAPSPQTDGVAATSTPPRRGDAESSEEDEAAGTLATLSSQGSTPPAARAPEDGSKLCPALYELASVHTRIIQLEEDAQKVPQLLEKLSTQSADLLHWRSQCETLEAELARNRGEYSALLEELKQVRQQLSSLKEQSSETGTDSEAPSDAVKPEDKEASPALSESNVKRHAMAESSPGSVAALGGAAAGADGA